MIKFHSSSVPSGEGGARKEGRKHLYRPSDLLLVLLLVDLGGFLFTLVGEVEISPFSLATVLCTSTATCFPAPPI